MKKIVGVLALAIILSASPARAQFMGSEDTPQDYTATTNSSAPNNNIGSEDTPPGDYYLPTNSSSGNGSAPVTDAGSLFAKLYSISNALVYLLISLALLYIIWNSVQFIRQTDSTDRKTYRDAILWGILGLFIILSIWGLVNILSQTFGLGNSGNKGQATQDMNSLLLK